MTSGAVGAESVLSGRYRLVQPLASGGMGTVWRGTDLLLDREVAIKEVRLPPGLDDESRETMRRRTIREAQAAARLRHPAIVTVYDVVDQDDRPWIVMEYVPAPSLADVIRTRGPLPPARVAAIGLRILDAMVTAQAAGVQHRDIKPANVLIDDSGRVVLTDFGIARHVGDETLTSAGLLVGSPDYLSPERARGLPSPGLAADLWSLGATMYDAVEGRRPFERDGPLPTLAAVVMDEPAPPVLAGPLRPVIDRLLVKDPVHRLDAEGTRAMLQRVIRGRPTGNTMPFPPADRPTGESRLAPERASGGQPGRPEPTLSDSDATAVTAVPTPPPAPSAPPAVPPTPPAVPPTPPAVPPTPPAARPRRLWTRSKPAAAAAGAAAGAASASTPKSPPRPATPDPATSAPATPISATPAPAAPASSTPGSPSPASASPASASPASATPASATPAQATQAPAAPASATPVRGTPAQTTSASAAPASAAPGRKTPAEAATPPAATPGRPVGRTDPAESPAAGAAALGTPGEARPDPGTRVQAAWAPDTAAAEAPHDTPAEATPTKTTTPPRAGEPAARKTPTDDAPARTAAATSAAAAAGAAAAGVAAAGAAAGTAAADKATGQTSTEKTPADTAAPTDATPPDTRPPTQPGPEPSETRTDLSDGDRRNDPTTRIPAGPARTAGPEHPAGPAGPAGPATVDPARTEPDRPHRRSGRRAALAGLVVLALAAVAGLVVPGLLDDGDPRPQAGPTATTAPAATAPASATAPAATGAAPATGTATPTATAPTATTPRPTPTGRGSSGAAVAAPAGFTRYTDPLDRFSVVVPVGWRPVRDEAQVDFEDPRSSRYLRIETSSIPKADPYTNWLDYERTYRQGKANYTRIGIRRVVYRPEEGWSTADWEFTIGRTHVLNRNVRVSDKRAHAIYWSTPSSLWGTAESRRIFDLAAASFVPAPAGPAAARSGGP